MTDDQLIDKVLFKLNEEYLSEYSIEPLLDPYEECDPHRSERIKDKMIYENLVEKTNIVHIKIKPFGVKICDNGGWLKYLETINQEHKNQHDKEQLEIDLAKSNIKSNRINIRFSKFNFWFTIINIIITISALCVAIYSAKHK
jgi:hypothetical protein